MKKVIFILLSLVLCLAVYAGWGPVMQRKTLVLAHNQDVKHPVHKGIEFFAERVEKLSEGQLMIRIYPNGQLGSEREVLEQVQLGAVSFTKVSSLSLESFSPLFGVLNTPFLFDNESHYYNALDGEAGGRLLEAGIDKKVLGLTYYNGGTRSFYAAKPILEPDDLKGLKLRVMGSQTAIRMTELLGGSPAPMPYGEIYTALQQSVIDGAENNITALTLSRHGEVAKHYSLDEHIMAPDVLLISTEVWASLSDEQREILKKAAEESKRHQRKLWAEAVADHERRAKEELGVEFHYPEREKFAAKVQPLHEELKARGGTFLELIELIEAAKTP